jgi:ribonuclease HI
MINDFFTSNKDKVNAIKANKVNENKVNENKEKEECNFKLQFDGCSKSNPGLAGAGAVIYNVTNYEIWNGSEFVGTNVTNNHAEYMGLIIGLKQAKEMKIKQLIVEGDSMLVIKQMKGEYKVKALHLIELYNEAKLLAKGFDCIYYKHIYRNNNKRADELSNIAVDNYLCKNGI